MGWRKEVTEKARSFYKDGTHDWGHVERVKKTALELLHEGDEEVVEAAALLHDVAYEKDWVNHGEKSAEMAREILKETSFPKEKIEAVVECIKSHRWSSGKTPETEEARVLQDADRLDAVGAVGVARNFLWTGRRNLPLSSAVGHFEEKLFKIKQGMHTEKAREIAEERSEFMRKFVKQLEKETSAK